MSYKAQAPVYNTDNGEKPPPSIEDERVSPKTFYKLATLDLESDSEYESEIEEYEACQEPYYDYKREERSRARSPSSESVHWQSSSKSYRDGHKPQATYERENYRRPTVPHSDSTEEYRARKRAERAARNTRDDEPQQPHYCRRAPSPEREEYRRPHVPYPSSYQYYSPRARSPPPPPTRPRYQPESYKSSSSSYSSSSRTRAKKLNHIRLRREEENRLKDRLRHRQNGSDETYQSRPKHEPPRSSRYEDPNFYESRSRPSYRDPEYGYDYARKEVRVPEPKKGEGLRVDVPEGWRIVVVVED